FPSAYPASTSSGGNRSERCKPDNPRTRKILSERQVLLSPSAFASRSVRQPRGITLNLSRVPRGSLTPRCGAHRTCNFHRIRLSSAWIVSRRWVYEHRTHHIFPTVPVHLSPFAL